jgi:hypothetical protein
MNNTAKILITTGATLLVGALFLSRKSKASQLNNYSIPPENISSQSKIIKDHDKIYDYKYENGVWYARKKRANKWINLQVALPPEKYQLAISRLNKYL